MLCSLPLTFLDLMEKNLCCCMTEAQNVVYNNVKSLYEVLIPKAIDSMIVYHSHSLHHRITDG